MLMLKKQLAYLYVCFLSETSAQPGRKNMAAVDELQVLSVRLVKDLAEMSIQLGLAWIFCLLMEKHTLAVKSAGTGLLLANRNTESVVFFFSPS